jgi:hypothetical protein
MYDLISKYYNIQWVLRRYDIKVRGKRPSLKQKLGKERFQPLLFYVYQLGLDPYVETGYFID